jgi:hypothetical protein
LGLLRAFASLREQLWRFMNEWPANKKARWKAGFFVEWLAD